MPNVAFDVLVEDVGRFGYVVWSCGDASLVLPEEVFDVLLFYVDALCIDERFVIKVHDCAKRTYDGSAC